ncbi:MAG: hypothetical protein JO013_06710 [Alphaproteobacteria bacterium]|nr:hypothetical protein [Alphaproteobacteria bacterium]
MPLYFLDVYNRTGCSRDEEGMDLADLDAARAQAVEGIRSILQDEVAHGAIDFEGRVEVLDAERRLLLTVGYREAVALRVEKEE